MSHHGDLRQHIEAWTEDLDSLRQNWLLNESAFLTFAKDRGLNAVGAITGEPTEFHRRGWLAGDDGAPRFHPFRLYPLHKILQRMKVATWKSPEQESKSQMEKIAEAARDWNDICDLAILLEPIYWPQITGRTSLGGGMREQDYRRKLANYRPRALDLVRSLDPNVWRERHASLRIDAAWIDKNEELYLLLRVGNWEQRQKLQGGISGALWIRHMAEVIRRAFEEVHSVRWLEEDQAFSWWHAKARRRAFGSERPLDDEFRSKPHLAYAFGLFTGSAVRWYLEGETEYYAVMEILPEAHRFGIELVNLRGSIKSGRDNVALKLDAMLKEDKAFRRFSMISIDGDVQANIKAIQRQARQDHIVGSITVHRPDFEFANFTIRELVDVTAQLDKEQGFSGDAVLNSDWTEVGDAGSFEKKYRAISERKPAGLKGKEWGRALARYANEHPRRSDSGEVRPLLHEIRAALHGWTSNYDAHKEHFGIDPDTFQQVPRTAE